MLGACLNGGHLACDFLLKCKQTSEPYVFFCIPKVTCHTVYRGTDIANIRKCDEVRISCRLTILNFYILLQPLTEQTETCSNS
jgi:hypothetical protein